jgi:protein arginine kinase activator
MLCDKCKKNEANIRVSHVINGIKSEQRLCAECAGLADMMQMMFHGMFGVNPQMFAMMTQANASGMPAGIPVAGSNHEEMSEADFAAMGLKLPGPEDAEVCGCKSEEGKNDIQALKKRLDEAVGNEAFEQAARLRDEIYILEQQEKECREASE